MRRLAVLLLAPAILITVIALLLPAIPQPLAYHNFADHRSWLGIPNFGDVVSNLPFAIIGVWGLIVLFTPGKATFVDARERWLYVVVFAALILTAWGSAYYHLAPDNARLVWDRIPITDGLYGAARRGDRGTRHGRCRSCPLPGARNRWRRQRLMLGME